MNTIIEVNNVTMCFHMNTDKILSLKEFVTRSLRGKIEYFDFLSADTNGVKTVKFTDYDNVERDLTKEQLELVRSELITNGQNLYNLKTSYRNQLNEAKTIAAIKAVSFDFTMLDFSK